MTTTAKPPRAASRKALATALNSARSKRSGDPAPGVGIPSKKERTAITTQIQEKVVIFILTIRGPGNERRIRNATTILDTKADHNRLKVTKKLIEAKEHKAIQSIDISIRAYIKRMALPSPFKEGVYALPLDLLEIVDERMQEYADERKAAVLALKEVYEAAKIDAAEKLGALYKESDYVIDLEWAYRLEWQYVSLSAPVQVAGKDNKIYTREQERLQRQWDEAIDDMRGALRVGLSELVNDLVKRLSNSADGEKRVKPSKLLERFQEFLNNFQARNVTSDDELTALAEQARKLLKGVNTETLIESADVRKQVEKGFKQVQSQLSKLELEAKGRRRFSFDDE